MPWLTRILEQLKGFDGSRMAYCLTRLFGDTIR